MAIAPARTTELRTEENVVSVGLTAAIVAIVGDVPCALQVEHPAAERRAGGATDFARSGLPFGPFDPVAHRTLESGLRQWVEEQTSLQLGYVEQLYTFGDRGRHDLDPDGALRVLSVGYLALTRQNTKRAAGTEWRSWYEHFPWEDWRHGRPELIDERIAPALERWLKSSDASLAERRRERIRQCFGLYDGPGWDEERVLERYEILYEAGLVYESKRDRGTREPGARGKPPSEIENDARLGAPMIYDHRRILATAMGRLRAKLKYRPVIFELMPAMFTLYDLQRTVEAISGVLVHKQNFRRLVETGGLVEETGTTTQTRGRPAQLFRFRREVLGERPAPGVRLTSPKHTRK